MKTTRDGNRKYYFGDDWERRHHHVLVRCTVYGVRMGLFHSRVLRCVLVVAEDCTVKIE